MLENVLIFIAGGMFGVLVMCLMAVSKRGGYGD